MVGNYVLFKGTNTLDIEGLKVVRLPLLSPPKFRVNKVSTPYSEGDYLEYQDVENIVKEVEFQYEGKDFDIIKGLFDGEGLVKFSNEEDRRYKCHIVDLIIEEKVLDYIYKVVVVFDCQPYSYLDSGEEVLTITEATVFKNLGNIESKPVITVYGNGDIGLVVGQVSIQLKNVNEYITINSLLMETYKGGMVQNNRMIGKFPLLEKGDTSISWSGGVTKLEVIPKWRCK